MDVELGIIEGFFGKPWTWDERKRVMSFLAPRGYGFYLYAPKADAYLRRQWKTPYPEDMADHLAEFAHQCQRLGVRFGVGLSPYEAYRDFDEAARQALTQKLRFFDAIGVQDVALLFDDMRGDLSDLADRQAEIVQWAAARSGADRIIVCPSYYSDDVVLDQAFGTRPDRYLEQLGAALDPAIEIFWTGEEVCSRAFSPGHLRRVTERLGRAPFLWDNYPVNDGQRMSQYLHLRAFTGRPASIGEHVAAHAINPALQPTLTCIPALTLVASYQQGPSYQYGDAFRRAAHVVLGEELGTQIRNDLLVLQDVGLDRLGERARTLRERYARYDHAGAREIVNWLDGAYRITDDVVQTQ